MTIREKLATFGIRSLSDVDRYSQEHPKKDAQGREYCDSRYGTLKDLIGERNADKVMFELMVSSWE